MLIIGALMKITYFSPSWAPGIANTMLTIGLVIEALIFAYNDDPYNRPEDLMFLKDSYLDSIEIIGYNCGQEHLTHLKDCRLEETKEKIIDYIRYRQLGNR